jgi:hypothetical protein
MKERFRRRELPVVPDLVRMRKTVFLAYYVFLINRLVSVEITVQKEEWPLFLMPVTFQPNLEGPFKITIFTLEDLEIEVAQ